MLTLKTYAKSQLHAWYSIGVEKFQALEVYGMYYQQNFKVRSAY